MATQKIPLYIPTFINSATYTPTRVLPRIYFYNGQVGCETWYVADENNATYGQNAFPYFDHYNVVSGSFPTESSKSLLFNNEAAVYGTMPSASVYTDYWRKYIEFLYNPKTRVLNCQAIIPLADYFKIELNDIVNFRGNYWHLRAINDYSLKTGECSLQLVGPVIPDVFDIEPPVPPTQHSSSVSWSYTETSQDGEFKVYDNGSTLATLTANGSGSSQVLESHYVTASLVPVSYPGDGVTMSINVNGGTTLSVTGSTNTTISASFLVGAGKTYKITGSIVYNQPPDTTLKVWLDAGNASSYPGSGTTWYDLTTNGNNLTLHGGPVYNSTTGSFYFPNSTSVYANNTSLSNTSIGMGSFSTEIWERYKGATTDGNYYQGYEWGMLDGSNYHLGGAGMAYGDAGLNDNELYERIGGIRLADIIPAYGDSGITYKKSTDYNIWRQVVVTRASGSGDVNMYVNGTLYKTINGMYTGTVNSPASLYVGSNNLSSPFGTQPFNGDIAIFKLWTDKVLTSAEVSASFNTNKSRFGY